ncbi:MAG TPA: hypothetical protein VKG65_06830, partial [Terriglobales bacterium]|nr:hypothetical protein [Terriglobales bacterium]
MQETNLIEQEQPGAGLISQVPAPAPTMTLCSYGTKLTREELARVATPGGTATHKPIPHIAVVEKLIEALGFRQIGVVREEYAVSSDGMRMFGVMDLSSGFDGCRFAIGLRNSHDKSFRLSCTVGLRVFVCENLAFHGDYTPGTQRVIGLWGGGRTWGRTWNVGWRSVAGRNRNRMADGKSVKANQDFFYEQAQDLLALFHIQRLRTC